MLRPVMTRDPRGNAGPWRPVTVSITLTAIEPDRYDKRVDAYVRLPDGRDVGDA
jgi:hypothetical protein